MQFWTLFFFVLAAMAVFFTPIQATSDADLETLLALKDKVTDFLAGSNLSPESKASIQQMVDQKQKAVEDSLGKRK